MIRSDAAAARGIIVITITAIMMLNRICIR